MIIDCVRMGINLIVLTIILDLPCQERLLINTLDEQHHVFGVILDTFSLLLINPQMYILKVLLHFDILFNHRINPFTVWNVADLTNCNLLSKFLHTVFTKYTHLSTTIFEVFYISPNNISDKFAHYKEINKKKSIREIIKQKIRHSVKHCERMKLNRNDCYDCRDNKNCRQCIYTSIYHEYMEVYNRTDCTYERYRDKELWVNNHKYNTNIPNEERENKLFWRDEYYKQFEYLSGRLINIQNELSTHHMNLLFGPLEYIDIEKHDKEMLENNPLEEDYENWEIQSNWSD